MAKKEDDELLGGSSRHEPETPLAEPPPSRLSSPDVTASEPPAPRVARFGEGAEGRPARRERGVTGHRAGFFERLAQFIRDVRAELKRVSWPTALEVRNTTIITIIAVIFFALYLFGVDWTFTKLIGLLERFISWLFGAV